MQLYDKMVIRLKYPIKGEINMNLLTIKDIRYIYGMSQTEMGEKLGVTQVQIFRLDPRPISSLKFQHIKKLSEISNIPLDVITSYSLKDLVTLGVEMASR